MAGQGGVSADKKVHLRCGTKGVKTPIEKRKGEEENIRITQKRD